MSPVSSFPTHSSTLTPTKKRFRFNMGRFVSRQFNFVYVAGSIIFLMFWPWNSHSLSVWERTLWVVTALLCGIVFVQGIKHICYVPRPNTGACFCWGRRYHSGLPSGHTVPAFLLATIVMMVHPAYGVLWYGGASLIGWARWHTQSHYAYQVVISAIMGIMLGLATMCWL